MSNNNPPTVKERMMDILDKHIDNCSIEIGRDGKWDLLGLQNALVHLRKEFQSLHTPPAAEGVDSLWPGINKDDHTLIAQIMIDYKPGVQSGGHPLDIAIGLIDNVYKASVASWQSQQGEGEKEEDDNKCSQCEQGQMIKTHNHTYHQSARYECNNCGNVEIFP